MLPGSGTQPIRKGDMSFVLCRCPSTLCSHYLLHYLFIIILAIIISTYRRMCSWDASLADFCPQCRQVRGGFSIGGQGQGTYRRLSVKRPELGRQRGILLHACKLRPMDSVSCLSRTSSLSGILPYPFDKITHRHSLKVLRS